MKVAAFGEGRVNIGGCGMCSVASVTARENPSIHPTREGTLIGSYMKRNDASTL
jgi:hypothetical protein